MRRQEVVLQDHVILPVEVQAYTLAVEVQVHSLAAGQGKVEASEVEYYRTRNPAELSMAVETQAAKGLLVHRSP